MHSSHNQALPIYNDVCVFRVLGCTAGFFFVSVRHTAVGNAKLACLVSFNPDLAAIQELAMVVLRGLERNPAPGLALMCENDESLLATNDHLTAPRQRKLT